MSKSKHKSLNTGFFTSCRHYYLDGRITDRAPSQHTWEEKPILHREDGPAVVYTDGTKKYQAYWIHGVKHRLEGPAIIYPDSIPTRYLFYIEGLNIHEKDFEEAVRQYKAKLTEKILDPEEYIRNVALYELRRKKNEKKSC